MPTVPSSPPSGIEKNAGIPLGQADTTIRPDTPVMMQWLSGSATQTEMISATPYPLGWGGLKSWGSIDLPKLFLRLVR